MDDAAPATPDSLGSADGLSSPAPQKAADEAGAARGADPFAHLVDEQPVVGGAAREEYLSVRGYVPIRKVLVQHHSQASGRPAVLGDMVRGRDFRPLILYLWLLASDPLLNHNRRLPLRTVANVLTTARYPCNVRQARLAINALERHNLAEVTWHATRVELHPLREDGSGEPWLPSAGDGDDPDVTQYMIVPHALFSDQVLDQLSLPGLATLLVALRETNKVEVFQVAVDRFAGWYGISERTAERGYRELEEAGLMRIHRQLVSDSRMPRGVRAVYHRTLLGDFGTQARNDARRKARKAVKRAAPKAIQNRKPS